MQNRKKITHKIIYFKFQHKNKTSRSNIKNILIARKNQRFNSLNEFTFSFTSMKLSKNYLFDRHNSHFSLKSLMHISLYFFSFFFCSSPMFWLYLFDWLFSEFFLLDFNVQYTKIDQKEIFKKLTFLFFRRTCLFNWQHCDMCVIRLKGEV